MNKRVPKTLFEHLGQKTKKSDEKSKIEALKKDVMSLVIFSALGFIAGLIIEIYVAFPVALTLLLAFIWVWLFKKYGHLINISFKRSK